MKTGPATPSVPATYPATYSTTHSLTAYLTWYCPFVAQLCWDSEMGQMRHEKALAETTANIGKVA